jgi:4-amino-4-deoxy-L-arabinose transferase-like glycosyltransferase
VSATITSPRRATDAPPVAPVDPTPPGAARSSPDPRLVRGLLAGLLGLTAVLYLWRLSASGYGNEFYAAAVQAGTQSWKAFFFGSLDAHNVITVDKPPASLWVMELSGRIFGFSSWSMLAPQALEGVAAVALLFATVRRTSGAYAGLVAGALLALTPVAALMFRFDNPDALLTLLLVAGAYCTTRAIEKAGTRWIVLAGTALGFAFLTKMLQGFLVVPAFGLVYLVAAPTTIWRRVRDVLIGALAIVVSAGWWVAIVELVPASDRPYVGGSTTNSILELTFGYNGLSRLTGGNGGAGGGGGGGGGAAFGGAAGITRLFGDSMGTQISWLLPAALVATVAGLWLTRRLPRTDRTRAAIVLWGGWLLVTGIVFSFMNGIVHPYYTVALAPAIAALVAIGGRMLWRARDTLIARIALAATVAGTAVWAHVLLDRTPSWHPALRIAVLAAAAIAAALILLQPIVARRRPLIAALVVAGAIAMLAAPTAFALQTASTAHSGSTPTAGPASAGSGFGGGGGRPTGSFGGTPPTGSQTGGAPPSGTRSTGTRPTGTKALGSSGTRRLGGGGQGGTATTSSALVALLKADTHTWAAATVGSQSAAPLELATGKSVIAIGGFTGSDPAPTLAQFEALVAQGSIHYFIAGGGIGGGGSGTSSAITSWVAAHYTAKTVGGQTVYDLTKTAK